MATKEVKPKRPPKTIKEKKFVKAYLKTGNATQAVIDAGYDVKDRMVARNIGAENLAKLGISEHFERAGLSPEVMAQNTTLIALTALKRDHFSGEMYEDYTARLNAMKFAAQLMGMVDGDKKGDTNVQVNIQPLLVKFLGEE